MLNAFLFVARKVLEQDQTTSEKRMVSGHSLVRVVHYFYLVYSVVEFYPCFKLYFHLFQTHYYPSTYQKQKKVKLKPRTKIIKPQHLFTRIRSVQEMSDLHGLWREVMSHENSAL